MNDVELVSLLLQLYHCVPYDDPFYLYKHFITLVIVTYCCLYTMSIHELNQQDFYEIDLFDFPLEFIIFLVDL